MFRCRSCLSPTHDAYDDTSALHRGDVKHRHTSNTGDVWENGSSAWCGLSDEPSDENCAYILENSYHYRDRIDFIYWSRY